MITSNTSIPFIKSENSENKFYLSRLTSEYNEGDSITTSTAINCRKLAIAIKAGDKITINGTSLTVYADAAVDATSFFVEEITLDEALNINANIAIDEDNMFVQYQRKTEGTVAGFDIDADGMSKGGVEITGWLDSDTMEGATENNIPTAQSVKAYVDGQAGHSETLQEVTDNGNTTTNDIMIGSSSAPAHPLQVEGGTWPSKAAVFSDGYYAYNFGYGSRNSGVASADINFWTNSQTFHIENGTGGSILFDQNGTERMRIDSSGNVGIGTSSPETNLHVNSAGGSGVTTQIKVTQEDDGGGNPGADAILQSSGWGEAYLKLSSHQIGAYGGDLNIRPANSADLVFWGGGSEQMRLTPDGNVGIGTTAPDEKLQVSGTLAITQNDTAYSGGYFTKIKSGYNANPFIIESKYGDLIKAEDYGKALSFHTGNTATSERLRITSAGNVGIGTTAPAYPLDVDGNIRATAYRIGGGTILSGTSTVQLGSGGATSVITLNTTSGEGLRLTGGNVGIGTTSPSAPLHVNSITTGEVLKLESTSAPFIRFILGGQEKGFLQFTNTHAYLSNQANGDFNFRTNNTDKLIIKADGNVGIGTTSPTTKLHISGGDIRLSNVGPIFTNEATNGTSGLRINTIGATGGSLVRIQGNGATKFQVNLNGNVLIGTTTDNNSRLRILGATSDTTQNALEIRNSSSAALFTLRNDGRIDTSGAVHLTGSLTGTTATFSGDVELDDVLTLNAISTPDDPADGKSSIYMDSADGDIKVKINLGGDVVTRTLASFSG